MNELQAAAAHLAPRQWEILRLKARGLANAEVAHQLSISVQTVKNQLSHVYRQLDVQSLAGAVYKIWLAGVWGETQPEDMVDPFARLESKLDELLSRPSQQLPARPEGHEGNLVTSRLYRPTGEAEALRRAGAMGG